MLTLYYIVYPQYYIYMELMLVFSHNVLWSQSILYVLGIYLSLILKPLHPLLIPPHLQFKSQNNTASIGKVLNCFD